MCGNPVRRNASRRQVGARNRRQELLCVLILRRVEDLLRGTALDDGAVLHDVHRMGDQGISSWQRYIECRRTAIIHECQDVNNISQRRTNTAPT